MVTKKGYIYTLEILVIVGILIIFASVFSVGCGLNKIPDSNNLKKIGYNTIYNLDKEGILETYFSNNIAQSKFTNIDTNIKMSLPKSVGFITEYNYESTCSSVGRICGSSDLAKTKKIDSIIYTFSKSPEPITIKLYLWSKL